MTTRTHANTSDLQTDLITLFASRQFPSIPFFTGNLFLDCVHALIERRYRVAQGGFNLSIKNKMSAQYHSEGVSWSCTLEEVMHPQDTDIPRMILKLEDLFIYGQDIVQVFPDYDWRAIFSTDLSDKAMSINNHDIALSSHEQAIYLALATKHQELEFHRMFNQCAPEEIQRFSDALTHFLKGVAANHLTINLGTL